MVFIGYFIGLEQSEGDETEGAEAELGSETKRLGEAMMDESFEEIFNDDFSPQNEYSHQLAKGTEFGLDEELGIDSDKEVIMVDQEDSGEIFGKNQEGFEIAVKNMQNELLSQKPITPTRISDFESKL